MLLGVTMTVEIKDEAPDASILTMVAKLDLTDEAAVLNYAQSNRHQLVEIMKVHAGGGDTKTINAIRGLLKDMDSSIFTGRRIQVEGKEADTNAELARQAATLLDDAGVGVRRHDGDANDQTAPDFDVSGMPVIALDPTVTSNSDGIVDIDAIVNVGLAKTRGHDVDED